jgi:chaperone modulatory protein CbpM
MPDKKTLKIVECEERFTLSLNEVCHSFGVTTETIITIVDEGIITPSGERESSWKFDSKDMQLIRTVLQLHNDLGINFAGAALALELLDEIQHLKALINQQS